MITTENGKHKKCRKNSLCECVIGQDPNSYQPRLIKCGKPAKHVWFWRQWFSEIIKEKSPIYSNVGANCCQECFDKIKIIGKPSDFERYKEMWEKNKNG